MENLTEEMKQVLEQIALQNSTPFCYGCYIDAPTGVCEKCHSDDLMKLVHGHGCEYGTDWVIEHLISESLTEADTTEAFEDSIRSCYEETITIGWITYDVVNAIKELDPVSFEMAESEWIDNEVSEGNLITFDNGGHYYWLHDVESFIDEKIQEQVAG